jgi:hypothetical protein
MRRFIYFVALVVALVSLSAVAQNTQQVTFSADQRLPDAPVYISAILIDGHKIAQDEPIAVSSDWSQHVSVVVTNASPKNVIEGTVQIAFLESGQGTQESPDIIRGVSVGRLPPVALFWRDGSTRVVGPEETARPSISVAPGSSITFDFSQIGPAAYKEAVSRVGTITKCRFTLNMFYFAGGNRWVWGHFYEPTSSPGQWIRMSSQDFFLGADPANQPSR